jgi:hypothetical protein
VLAVVAGGCASSSAAGSASVSGFRSSFAADRPRLHLLEADLSSELLGFRGMTSAHLGQQAYTLAVTAQDDANAITGLDAPTRYNTRVRDLRAALIALVNDLSAVSTATADHNRPATASALSTVRTDAGDLAAVDGGLSQALGLKPD